MTWPLVRLGDVLDTSIGGVWGKPPGEDDVEVRVWRVTELKTGGCLDPATAASRSVSVKQFESRALQAGDLLLEKSGGGPATPVGRVGLVRAVPEPAICSNFMQLLRPCAAKVEPRYLHLYLNHFHAGGGTLSFQTSSTNIRNIKASDYVSIAFPLPPQDEQRRIVGILEDHLSRLDAADIYLHAAQRRNSALHGQLLDSELAVVESEDLPLAELLTTGLANGKSVPTQEGGFPVLRLTALRDGRIDLAERKPGAWTRADASRFLVERGDFLIARGNGSLRLVGRGGLVTEEPDAVAFPDTLIRARPDLSRIRPEFMTQVWNAHGVRRQIEKSARTTAGIYKVNQKDLAAVRVPVPSLEDQDRITAAVRESRDALSQLSVEVGRAITRSSALRRSLLGAAFSGRLTGEAADLSEAEEMIGA